MAVFRSPLRYSALRPVLSATFSTASTIKATMPLPRYFSSYLVTPAELNDALKKNAPTKISTLPRTIPLCATWFLPNDGRKGIDTYIAKRIPSSRFFDIDKVCDKNSEYPHMLPSAKKFATAMSELGIKEDDTVVVYDSHEDGIFSAPRAAWTLRVFGHGQVHILNNFKLWVEQGLPTEKGEFFDVNTCPYHIPEKNDDMVAEFGDVKDIVQDRNKEGAEDIQIIDARSAGRWSGKDAEPRPGLSSGHMPGSINLPITELLDKTTKAFLPKEELIKVFEKKGIDPNKPLVTSCGTGVTAAIIEAAMTEANFGTPDQRRIYDGSWTEWAQRVKPSDNLIEKS